MNNNVEIIRVVVNFSGEETVFKALVYVMYRDKGREFESRSPKRKLFYEI